MGNIETHFPFTLFFLYKQKWVTITEFGERLANWPHVAFLFIVGHPPEGSALQTWNMVLRLDSEN